MRILHVVAEIDPKKGGVGQAVRTLMSALSEHGLQNEAVCMDANNAGFLSNKNLAFHALGPGKGPWCYSSLLLPWLKENLCIYETIIVHGLWLYPGYAVQKALKFLKANQKKLPRLFIMPHGMLDPYFQKAAGRKLKAIRNEIYWKLIEEKLINKADGIFFTSSEEKKLASQPFKPYHPKSQAVVGLGIEMPPSFMPGMQKAFYKRCPQVKNHPYFLYLGRIDEKKGVDILIRAYIKYVHLYKEQKQKLIAVYNEGHIDGNVVNYTIPKLVIAGPGMETYYGQKMMQLASLYSSEIFFPGMLSGDAKWGAFYSCEAFILPSHQENFGIAVVESLSCGRPVLISNKVNIWKEIENSGAGIVEEDTENGTLKILKEWNKLSPGKKQSMGEKGLQCFKDNFSIQHSAYRIKNEITNVCVFDNI